MSTRHSDREFTRLKPHNAEGNVTSFFLFSIAGKKKTYIHPHPSFSLYTIAISSSPLYPPRKEIKKVTKRPIRKILHKTSSDINVHNKQTARKEKGKTLFTCLIHNDIPSG
jgi:hypothetical protein